MRPILLFDGFSAEYDELSIEFKLENPMFSENKFNTEYTYDFTLPLTARNQRIYKYKNRFDTARISSYSFQCVLGAGLFIEGIAKMAVTGSSSISVSVISYGIDFVQKIQTHDLKDIDFGTIDVYEEDDSLWDKQQKWQDHKFEQNFTLPSYQGSHKFPMIWTSGYEGNYGDKNYLSARNSHVVNVLAEGNFINNWGVFDEDKTNASDKWWPFTIAPCPRIHYLIEQVFSWYNVRKISGDLWSNMELQQMILFAGVVLDEEQQFSAGTNYKVNVHGAGFKLADFVPDVKVIELFQTLNEIYGAYFSMSSAGRFTIRTYRETLSKKAIDVSKYCIDEQPIELSDTSFPSIVYEVASENNIVKQFLQPWDYTVTGINDFEVDQTERGINLNPLEKNEETQLRHFPMKSVFFTTEGFDQDRAQYLYGEDGTRRGYGELMPRFIYPYGIMTLGDASNDYRADRFFVGYYRGVYDTLQIHMVDGIEVTDTISTCWPYSNSHTVWDSRNTTVPFDHLFGTSLYLAEQKGTYQEYLREYYRILNGDILKRKMIIPEHVLIKMTSFEQIKHLIRDRRGAIVGYLKSISGTITDNGVMEIEAEYLIPKRVLSEADFNGDFSSDFY